MVLAFAFLLVAHGAIHLLGFAKAFGLADLPQLTRPISPLFGVLWLIAAVLFAVASAALFAWTRGWWVVAACALVISTIAIVPSWVDARVGAVANAVVLGGVVFGFLAHGPVSLLAEYEHDLAAPLSRQRVESPLRGDDIAHLPAAVQRYLEIAGVIGNPRVRNFHASIHGRIRSAGDARWMPIRAEQHNFLDPPARLFYLTGTMLGIPVQGYHRYIGSLATMRVKTAAVVPVATASGLEMTQSETVTLFNDMCLLAPATLVDPSITWESIDTHTVTAAFTNANHTITARLSFNDSGELVNFVSDDRFQLMPDGTTRRVRWSTPVGEYRRFGHVRLPSRGEGRWHAPDGEFTYIELTIDDVRYNLREP